MNKKKTARLIAGYPFSIVLSLSVLVVIVVLLIVVIIVIVLLIVIVVLVVVLVIIVVHAIHLLIFTSIVCLLLGKLYFKTNKI